MKTGHESRSTGRSSISIIHIGSGYSLKGSQIPSYKEADKIPYQINLTLRGNYTQIENKRIFDMINFLKKENLPPYGIIFVRYQDKTVNIQDKELNSIQSENDISNFAH